jgi:phospholipid/cholesterol/gamma-HCH transport system substrate-binding protein
MQQRSDRIRNVLLGTFVLVIGALFLFGMLQAEAVREWLNPSRQLRLVLPDEGLYGLSEGAKIEVLGTRAGRVTQIVIRPDEKIHAEAKIRPDMAPFVRRDSEAIIRKTFGVAGESFVEITRGYETGMDWDYAVLEARPDRAPTESIGEMMEDVRSRVIPILEQSERALTALADLIESLADPDGSLQVVLADVSSLTSRVERGEGSLGQLLANERTALEFEALLGNANATVERLPPILEELQAAAGQVTALSRAINAQSADLPAVNVRIQSILASLDSVMGDLRETSPQLPKISRDVSAATASVPVLLGMTQQTLAELELLLRQLRNSWLLGGGGPAPAQQGRLPPSEVRP